MVAVPCEVDPSEGMAEVRMMADSCPQCGHGTVLGGKCLDWHLASATRFEPDGLRRLQIFRLRSSGVPLQQQFCVCVACGLVWSALNLEDLRTLIEHHGTDETKALLLPPGALPTA